MYYTCFSAQENHKIIVVVAFPGMEKNYNKQSFTSSHSHPQSFNLQDLINTTTSMHFY